DAAMVAVSAEAGVQVGTERAWTVAERLGLPRMVVVTKLDKGGDYYASWRICGPPWAPSCP
ncbi:MAG: GTP-binding protein, partial [Thermus sp.]